MQHFGPQERSSFLWIGLKHRTTRANHVIKMEHPNHPTVWPQSEIYNYIIYLSNNLVAVCVALPYNVQRWTSNNLTSHMQLKGRYALLVHVRAVYTVVRIGLKMFYCIFIHFKNFNKRLCDRQISDHLDLDLHRQACIRLQRPKPMTH